MAGVAHTEETALPRERIFEEAIRPLRTEGIQRFEHARNRGGGRCDQTRDLLPLRLQGGAVQGCRALVLRPRHEEARTRVPGAGRASAAGSRIWFALTLIATGNNWMRCVSSMRWHSRRNAGRPQSISGENERPHLELLTGVFQDAVAGGQALNIEPEAIRDTARWNDEYPFNGFARIELGNQRRISGSYRGYHRRRH